MGHFCDCGDMAKLWFAIGLGVAAAAIAYGTPLFVAAAVVAVVAVWCNGIIFNFSHDISHAPRGAFQGAGLAFLASILLIMGSIGFHIFDAFDDEDAPYARRTSERSYTSSGGEDDTVEWYDAENVVGELATVCGPVRQVLFDGGDTFINIGMDYPNPTRFTVVVWNVTFRRYMDGDNICASGRISEYQGVAQLETFDPNDDLALE